MSWVAAAVAGATLISGSTAADAAGEAAGQQAGASRYSADLQKQMFDIQNRQQGPYREAGYSALNRMNYLLGLDTAKTYDQYRQELLPQYTRGTSGSTGLIGADRNFYDGQQNALPGRRSLANDILGFVPSDGGGGGSSQTIDEAALDAAIRARMSADAAAPKGEDFGKYGREFSMSDFEADPGYAFRLKMGQDQAMRQANLGGGAMSGNALAGLQDYTQGSASQEYTNTFNRYQTERGNIFNTLASIAGLGQTSLGQTTAASGQAGANIGQAISNAGSALAGGTIGAANAYSGAIQGVGNQYYLNNLLKPQTQTPTGYGTPVSQPFDINVA